MHYYRRHGRRFALKDPTHSVFVETILAHFADAKFVFMHRDPASTMSSLCSLYAYTRALFSDDVDPRDLGRELLNSYLPQTLETALANVDRLPPGRVAHVRAPELFSNPLATIEQVYADLRIELSEDARRRMQALLHERARAPKDVHIHSPEGFGLTPEAIRGRLAAYCERLDI